MHTVNADKSTRVERPTARLLYFLALGVIAGAALIAFALLPQQIAVLAPVLAIVATLIVDRAARRSSVHPFTTRPGRVAIVYFVVFGIVWLGGLLLVGAVARDGDSPWLPWILAGVVFVVTLIGTWIPEGRSTHRAAPTS
ncbi:hypothetical protein [Leifsonia sp. NPDC058230]|uniref:hypothetical protein n=1 Tax=Leifsonia sp. NPDC058230 TaxID=3346391 RepID=UPI0036D7AE39